jgi:CHAT domain-containing protein
MSAPTLTPSALSAYQDQQSRAQKFDDRCDAHFQSGEYEQALECFDQALRLTRAAGDRAGEAAALTAIGVVYATLGEFQRALEYYNQALPIARAVGDRHTEAATLTRIGWIHWASGQPQQALKNYDQALSIHQAAGDRAGEAELLSHIAAVYATSGEYQRALESQQQALALRRALGDRVMEAIALNQIAAAYRMLGRPQQALDTFAEAQAVWGRVRDPRYEIPALVAVARTERELGRLSEARRSIETALDMIEFVSAKVTSYDLRASYRASMQRYYEFYITLLMQMHQRDPSAGHDAAALELSERARARRLLEVLSEARADIRQGVDPALLDRERALQRQLNAKERDHMKLLSGNHTDEQIEAAEKELRDLLTEYQRVQAEVRARSPHYAALMQPQPLGLREIQEQVLDENTLLLEYAYGEERSYLWAVTPASFASFVLPKRAEIESAARRVYELLTARNKSVRFETAVERQSRIAQADADYAEAAAALSEILLGPVAGQLGTKRLLIVGDGALQYVPFGALPAPVKSEKLKVKSEELARQRTNNSSLFTLHSPLILDHEIVSLPSASVLAVLRRELAGRRPAPRTVAVLADPVFDKADPRVKTQGKQIRNPKSETQNPKPNTNPQSTIRNPQLNGSQSIADVLTRAARGAGLEGFDRLEYARQEAEQIIALAVKQRHLKALDFAANRATATSDDLSRYRIVHFATHGLVNSEHPELSGLVLSLVDERGQPQDGFLRLHEIYNLNVPAELVVLSACRTAFGKEIKGEGLIGLTRGFMYAGAARVVASLWDVADESTAELMRRFYHGMLREGLRPAAALRAAQVAMWKQRRWQSPYYWAGFILQGEWK